ncbi:FecR family protein [Rhodoferax saidenbachensis]|uniref:FecR protein domain-containing protein n=1 Tax=Rhodoferax saidenbachensis TaxID=1484693 RepID=A0ABU1ZLM0_9BURK|nr:FecR family protein [Rhodoferax saidenbachensis]MDR7306439.1 hypothetical protein [Rhodoferax saidenbachensis]
MAWHRGWVGRSGMLLALAMGLSQAAGAQELRSGTLKAVQGSVEVIKGEARRVAAIGGPVAEAERIVTGAGGSAVILLRDGTLLTVGPNSQVDITRFQFDSTTQTGSLTVQVLLGTIRMVTGLLGKLQPENVKVGTPSSTVSVRGTDFIVEVP